MRTFHPRESDIQRAWHVIDAEGIVLGRLATEIAHLLRGKHKPIWAPNVDAGDHVIVVNAGKLDISLRKSEDKLYYRHSGYPGGIRSENLGHLHGAQPRARGPPRGPRHAPEDPARPRPAQAPPDLRRPDPPARRAAAAAAHPDPVEEGIVSKPLIQTTGRRKEAVARVRLRPGTGKVVINGRDIEGYFHIATHRTGATEALRLTQTADVYDVDATIRGGGIAGQSGALSLGIARALVALDPEARPGLKKAGLLTRDAREKERRKYGLKKARKAPQYSKR